MTYNPENGPPLTSNEILENHQRAHSLDTYWSFEAVDTGIDLVVPDVAMAHSQVDPLQSDMVVVESLRAEQVFEADFISNLSHGLTRVHFARRASAGPSSGFGESWHHDDEGLSPVLVAVNKPDKTAGFRGVVKRTNIGLDVQLLEGDEYELPLNRWMYLHHGAAHRSPTSRTNDRLLARCNTLGAGVTTMSTSFVFIDPESSQLLGGVVEPSDHGILLRSRTGELHFKELES